MVSAMTVNRTLSSVALPAAGAWVSWIGWIATAAFGVSYFAKTPKALRIVQACAALLWIAYGFIIHAMPVVVANAIVAGAAVYSSFAPPRAPASTYEIEIQPGGRGG